MMCGLPMFGSHLSIAGGLHNALIEAADMGMDCVQIFTKNQRQWRATPLSDDAIGLWQKYQKQTKIFGLHPHIKGQILEARTAAQVHEILQSGDADEMNVFLEE